MFYIFGLGNPEAKYDGTRHNIGRDAVRQLATSLGVDAWEKSKHANALYTRGTLAGSPVELLLPETYMNRSGEAVRYVKEKHGARPEDCIVVYDEVDLPLGTVRITHGRGDGGHNGIKSVIDGLNSKDFTRIRIGIAPTSFWTGKVKRPASGGPLERFVLAKFSRREQRTADAAMMRAGEAIEAVIRDGVEKAMNTYNR